ncbi:MAG TPA: heavy-metal-associated domain-containing protein [Telluria sp.]
MMKFSIPDMSCGHCSGVITKAIKDIDSTATVDFDMAARTATVNTSAGPDKVLGALSEAGYPAALMQH